ncbi:MAG: metallopeptidase family protein [Elusimicrobiales bacterium]|nr:metallopeptidase family protein [Elusimicrobiales bacterium]
MDTADFEKLAERAIRRLPRAFRARLENVVITVAAAPSRTQARRFGRNLLGLYEGVPLPDRGVFYSGAMPDKITLFKNNLETGCRGPAQVEARVRHTLMHEIAHHFGMDDEELLEKGLY